MGEFQLNINTTNDLLFDNFINFLSEVITDYIYTNQERIEKTLVSKSREE